MQFYDLVQIAVLFIVCYIFQVWLWVGSHNYTSCLYSTVLLMCFITYMHACIDQVAISKKTQI